MKKLLPIIVVLVIIAGGAYFYFNRSGGQTGELPATSDVFQGSLEMAVSRGIPVKCEWEDEGVKATTYIKGENIYSETLVEGATQYAIMKDNCTWTWDSTGEQALKFCSDETDYSDFDPAADMGEEVIDVEPNAPVETTAPEYNCVPTTVSDSMFEPPADVEFMSF